MFVLLPDPPARLKIGLGGRVGEYNFTELVYEIDMELVAS